MSDYNPFDLEQQSKDQDALQKQVEKEAKTEVADLRFLMSSKNGRRIACRLLGEMGVWQSSFNSDALQMAFREGRRSIGLSLTAKLMNACPENYFLMLEEYRKND